jgi:hypothetical protein
MRLHRMVQAMTPNRGLHKSDSVAPGMDTIEEGGKWLPPGSPGHS